MPTTTKDTSRTTHLLTLMKKGDGAFNARDFAAVDEVYHPDMVACITGLGDWITVVTNATGTFTGEMTLPDGTVIAPAAKAFDVEFGQTTKWDGDQLIATSAFWGRRFAAPAARPRLTAQRGRGGGGGGALRRHGG
ncbi:MAG: hypothetical protein ACR2MP_31985, partial [Streptosporangiaceae bacterium]